MRFFAPATVAVLGWGALAFGAEFSWAYAPLLVLCATVGLLGREGATLRKAILPALYYMILIGVLGLIAVYVLRVPGPLWAG